MPRDFDYVYQDCYSTFFASTCLDTKKKQQI